MTYIDDLPSDFLYWLPPELTLHPEPEPDKDPDPSRLVVWGKLGPAEEIDALVAAYRPDQTRCPAGTPLGGQWVGEHGDCGDGTTPAGHQIPAFANILEGARDGGFTVLNGEVPTSGYVVAVKGHSVVVNDFSTADDAAFLDAMAEYLDEKGDVLAESDSVGIGGWWDKSDDTFWLDIVEVFEDREEAIAEGRARNERAIYGIVEGQEISTGGTGNVEASHAQAHRRRARHSPFRRFSSEAAARSREGSADARRSPFLRHRGFSAALVAAAGQQERCPPGDDTGGEFTGPEGENCGMGVTERQARAALDVHLNKNNPTLRAEALQALKDVSPNAEVFHRALAIRADDLADLLEVSLDEEAIQIPGQQDIFGDERGERPEDQFAALVAGETEEGVKAQEILQAEFAEQIKADPDGSRTKAQVVADIHKRMRDKGIEVSEGWVSEQVRAWAQSATSGDRSILAQYAASRKFGDPYDEFGEGGFLEGQTIWESGGGGRKLAPEFFEGSTPEQQAMYTGFIDAVYESTQEKLAELGITEITVQRGSAWDEYDDGISGIATGSEYWAAQQEVQKASGISDRMATVDPYSDFAITEEEMPDVWTDTGDDFFATPDEAIERLQKWDEVAADFESRRVSSSGDLWTEDELTSASSATSEPFLDEALPLELNPLSSWTSDPGTALAFTNLGYGGGANAGMGDESAFSVAAVSTTTVPAANIWSTALTGPGALGEREVIVTPITANSQTQTQFRSAYEPSRNPVISYHDGIGIIHTGSFGSETFVEYWDGYTPRQRQEFQEWVPTADVWESGDTIDIEQLFAEWTRTVNP
jgi:hypothetical protein